MPLRLQHDTRKSPTLRCSMCRVICQCCRRQWPHLQPNSSPWKQFDPFTTISNDFRRGNPAVIKHMRITISLTAVLDCALNVFGRPWLANLSTRRHCIKSCLNFIVAGATLMCGTCSSCSPIWITELEPPSGAMTELSARSWPERNVECRKKFPRGLQISSCCEHRQCSCVHSVSLASGTSTTPP